MRRRLAMLIGTLFAGSLLVGCQNAPQQFSIYAPFGPSVVPTPSLSRANSTPYYTPPTDPKSTTAGHSPPSPNPNGGLSHYDPYRGLLVPGNFSPAPVAVRTDETWGTRDAALAAAPRERASSEEPIRIVEGTPSTIVAQSSRSGTATSPALSGTSLSGAVRPLLSLPPPPAAGTSVEIATRARTSAPPAISPAPAPLNNPPGLIAPPATSPPASPAPAPSNPGEPRRLSLWDSPRDGSRVMPASHREEAPLSSSPAAGSWRVRD